MQTAYVSIGANRASSGCASSKAGVFAYGAGSTVALWDTVSALPSTFLEASAQLRFS